MIQMINTQEINVLAAITTEDVDYHINECTICDRRTLGNDPSISFIEAMHDFLKAT